MASKRKPSGVTISDLDSMQEDSWVIENNLRTNPNMSMPKAPQLSNFIGTGSQSASGQSRSQKAKSSKKKKALMNLRTQLPPMDMEGRLSAEHKIEELQRIATANSRQYEMLSRTQSESMISNVSGSEADFLVRQLHSRETLPSNGQSITSVIAAIAPPVVTHVPSPSRFGALSVSSELADRGQQVSSTLIIGNLKEKIKELETQNATLTTQLRTKDMELEKCDGRIRMLMNESDRFRRDFQIEIKKLKDDHELALITAKEAAVKEKALLLQASDNVGSSGISNKSMSSLPSISASNSQHSSNNTASQQFEQTRKTLQACDQLRLELRNLHASFADERRQLLNDHQGKITQMERKQRADINELQSQLSKLEDQLQHTREDYAQKQHETNTLKSLLAQCEAQRSVAIAEQQKLRADLKNVNQSVASSYRLDATSTSSLLSATTTPATGIIDPLKNLPPDIETALRLKTSAADAKLKQATNKIEFLKQQFETERKHGEDLKLQIQHLQIQLEETVQQQQQQKLEERKARELLTQQTEEKMNRQYENKMNELTFLQRQITAFQTQTETAKNEVQNLREKEANFEDQISRLQTRESSLLAEVEVMRNKIHFLENSLQKSQAGTSQAGNNNSSQQQQQQEVAIRRLDNERHYLKAQLTSEISLKNDLQLALSQCQQQLQQTQTQWNKDITELQESHLVTQGNYEEKLRHLTNTETELRSELTHHQRQVETLREACSKLRDAHRLQAGETTAIEAEKDHFKDSTFQLQQEISRLLTHQNALIKQHDEQVESLQTLLSTQEQLMTKEVTRLKEELSKQFLANSALQLELLQHHKNETVTDHQKLRLLALQKVLLSRQKKIEFFMLQKLKKWSVAVTLQTVAMQFKSSISEVLKKVQNDAQQLQQEALNQQKVNLEADFQTRLEHAKHDFEAQKQEEMDRLHDAFMKEKQELQSEHEKTMFQVEQDHDFDLQSERQQHTEKFKLLLQETETQVHKLQLHHKGLLASREKELQQQSQQALIEQENRLTKANQDETFALNKAMEVSLQRALQQQRLQFDEQIALLSQDHQNSLTQAKTAFQEQLKAREISWTEELNKIKQAAIDSKDHEILGIKQHFAVERDKAVSNERALLHEQFEDRIRQLRQDWAFETESAIISERDTQLMQAKHDQNVLIQTHQETLQEAIKSVQTKLETAWQEEKQQLLAKIESIAKEVRDEANSQHAVTIERIVETQELTRIRDKEEYKTALEALQLEHDRQRELFAEQCQEEALRTVATLSAAKETEIRQHLHSTYEQTLRDKDNQCQAIVKSEQAKVEQLKADIAQRNHLFAAERANLLLQLQAADGRLESLESVKKVEVAQLYRDFQQEKELLSLQHTQAISALQARHESEKVNLRDELQEQFASELSDAIENEREKLTQEMETQLNQLQQESNAQLSELEQGLTALRAEKLALAANLDNLTSRLEETEDGLFDAQTALKAEQKTRSLQLWRAAASMLQLKLRFKQALVEVDATSERNLETQAKQQSQRYAELFQQLLAIASCLYKVDQRRQQILTNAAAYKQPELKRLKRQISQLENDLEVLSSERESSEQQRRQLLTEAEQLAEEVRKAEAAAVAAAQESSVSADGRVNVAVARKKRRLEAEIERLLEAVDAKRQAVSALDDTLVARANVRDETEAQLVDVERQLVGLLIEQQRFVLGEIRGGEGFVERAAVAAQIARCPWPPPAFTVDMAPTVQEAQGVLEQMQQLELEAGRGKLPVSSPNK